MARNMFGIRELKVRTPKIRFGLQTSRGKKLDSRRAFSSTQKNDIWDNQKGRCKSSRCGHSQLLRGATHYDHIKPYEDGGKTIVKNGQALCATCHSLKTNKDRLKKVDKKRSNKRNPNIFGDGSRTNQFGF